jgi:hypothetical protein
MIATPAKLEFLSDFGLILRISLTVPFMPYPAGTSVSRFIKLSNAEPCTLLEIGSNPCDSFVAERL